MLLVRLSGHSGAGKSRLLAALVNDKFNFRRAVIYASRPPRIGEVHGRDYYFMSRGFIESLPTDRFLVGEVRDSVQAIDLAQLEMDLRSGEPVIAEVFHTRWQPLKARMQQILGPTLRIASVFLTAISPESLMSVPKDQVESQVREEVSRILHWRRKDSLDDIKRRAQTAVVETTEALTTPGLYDKVFLSAPEGPDGEDDWTRGGGPKAQAAETTKKFVEFLKALG